MKLILQAIKSLFRKQTIDIQKTIHDSRSDWKQNDETAPNYLKNRPFHEERRGTLVLFEQDNVYANAGQPHYFESEIELIEGETHYVEIDGVTHKVIATKDAYQNTLLQLETGEIYENAIYAYCENVLVKIYKDDVIVYPIDSKYIGTLPIRNGGTGKNNVVDAALSLGRGYGTCDSSASSANKVVNISEDFSIVNGTIIGVKFSYANTASNPKLRINGISNSFYINNYKTSNSVKSGEMGACLHLFMYADAHWYLLNPLK